MVDKLIIEAQVKLSDFATAWRKRADEFKKSNKEKEYLKALQLSSRARELVGLLGGLLMQDKELDEVYDRMKGKNKT